MKNIIEKNRRLAILCFLANAPEYSMNASVIQSALHSVGHSVSRDRVVADSAWLEEQGLVEMPASDLPVAVIKLTHRGLDVSKGLATHPGVDRPLP